MRAVKTEAAVGGERVVAHAAARICLALERWAKAGQLLPRQATPQGQLPIIAANDVEYLVASYRLRKLEVNFQ